MKKLMVAVLVSLFMLSGPVLAEGTLNAVIKKLDYPEIMSYLMGMERGVHWANTHSAAMKGELLYCRPENAADEPIYEIVKDAVREKPELGELPAGAAVMGILFWKYPCDDEEACVDRPGKPCMGEEDLLKRE